MNTAATFDEIGIEENILKAIKEMGFEKPMPVQAKVIPHLMQDEYQDLVALAQTGTGKTAAFGLPLIQKTNTAIKHTQHLILCPTRELCFQISGDLAKYTKYYPEIKITAVFGGTSIDRQIKIIRQGVHIIVATPGRLLDLLRRKVVNITKIKTVVLDEADEMLNMGFRDELTGILETTPDNKNTLLFSATMPKEVMRIASRYMKNPLEITIGKRNVGAENVNHICYMVHAKDRYQALKRIADYYPDIYGIIFCRTRKETQEVADMLMKDGYNADAIHGDLSQAQRDYVMNRFRIRQLRLLVATDVAARGLDVDDLTHIINYNLPDDYEIYTHRSGRTGRAGKFGTSIAIANLKEKFKLTQIERTINKKFKHLPVPGGKEICEKQLLHFIDRMEKVEVNASQIESFLPQIYHKLEWLERDELIKKFVSLEFNRFLNYYRNAPDLNVPEKGKGKGERRRESEKKEFSKGEYSRFFINLGSTDNLNPVKLIGMINDFTSIRNINIGEIEIKKNFSFFEADSSFLDEILKGFKNRKQNSRQINLEVAEKKKTASNQKRGKKSFKQNFKKKTESRGGKQKKKKY